MTVQEYNNQGFEDAAKAHGLSPVLAELEAINRRDALARQKNDVRPYCPAPEPHREQGALDAAIQVAKPVAVLAVAGGVVAVVVAVVSAAVGAVFAFVATNALWIGGGLFGVVVVVLGFFGSRGAKDGNGSDAPPSGGDGWEFYQKQEQGWRKT